MKITREKMINELIHYVNIDLDDKPEEKIREMYVTLFGEEALEVNNNMIDKIDNILLEMYSVEIRGGFGLFDVMIPLAEEIHCELKETDIDLFRQRKSEIDKLVFGDRHPHEGDWDFKYNQYMSLLNDYLLEVK